MADDSNKPLRARFRVRPETLLLLFGLFCTLAAKFYVSREQSPLEMIFPFFQVSLPDAIFFIATAGVFGLLYVLPWRGMTARLTLVLALLIMFWSMFNAAWLLSTGVQLQPGVMLVLAQSTDQFWPMLQNRLARHWLLSTVLVVTAIAAFAWFVWRMYRPIVPPTNVRLLSRRTVRYALALIVLTIAHQIALRPGAIAYSGQVIGFSSHWYAITNIVAESTHQDIQTPNRSVPRVGERKVTRPDAPSTKPPNVVVFLLESVPFAETTMAHPERNQTPALAKLASEGVEFRQTYVPVPLTTKAFWATFTGSTPEIRSGYAEALLVDRPYESLASLLRPHGYRSAFFQMSTGTFECLPALFHNMDFDWAWFFENLRDPAAGLSALTGDDSRLIEPMFQWVESGPEPFLLTLITSVSHDPYLVPSSFEAPAADREARYRQTIRFTDAVLAMFLQELERRGLAENTIVCVLGDHGESFRPESKRGRWGLFEEIVRIPWVIRWPSGITAGKVVDWQCSQMDVTPTLLHLMGMNIEKADFDGRNALEVNEQRRLYFASWHQNSPLGYVEGNRKIVYWPTSGTMFEYDLVSDPGEQRPHTLTAIESQPILEELLKWQQQSHMYVEPRRFREALIYDHWRVFSSGRTGRALFVDTSK